MVANGVPAPKVPDGVRVVELPTNVGIPAGRNAGLEAVEADIIMFVDDDGWLASAGTAERLRGLFAAEPELGIVSFRITDPDTGSIQRRHVPRVRVGDPKESSEVTTFLGGAAAIRRLVFDDVGVFPAIFFYAHEETDFAWRALDAGWRIRYDAGCVLCHPVTLPTRHPTYFRLNARNRVLAGEAQPAAARGRRLPADLDSADRCPHTYPHGVEGLVERAARRCPHAVRPAKADRLAHRVAYDPARKAPAGMSSAVPPLAPASVWRPPARSAPCRTLVAVCPQAELPEDGPEVVR